MRSGPIPRGILPSICLLLLTASFAGCSALWISLDRYPPTWDDAYYLNRSLIQFDALVDHGVFGYIKQALSILGPKAPLIALLPTPLYLLFGRHWHAAFAVNMISMALLFAAVFSIAKRLSGNAAGLLAAALCGTMPLLYGLSRSYLVDFPLTALTAATIALLIAMGTSHRAGPISILLGITAGMGLLMKVTFPVFIAGPVSAHLIAGNSPRHLYRAMVLAGALALPWYAVHWRDGLAKAVSAGYLAEGANYGAALPAYLSRVRGAVSGYDLALLVVGAGVLIVRPGRRSWLPVWLWLVPFLLLLTAANKDIRFFAPLCPAIAILIAGGLCSLAPRSARPVLTLALLFPVASMLRMSFAPPLLAHISLLRSDCPYVRRYDPREWPNQHLIEALPEGTRLLTATDTAAFNADNLSLMARAMRRNVRIESSAYTPNQPEALAQLDHATWFVFKDGGEPEAAFFNEQRTALLAAAPTRGFEPVAFPWMSPDGGTVRLMRLRVP